MNVDFNNLRKQAAFALGDLVKELNHGILKEHENVWDVDAEGNGKWKRGNVLVDADDISKHIEDLRRCVVAIACCFEEGDDNFKMVMDEINDNGGIERFNDSEED